MASLPCTPAWGLAHGRGPERGVKRKHVWTSHGPASASREMLLLPVFGLLLKRGDFSHTNKSEWIGKISGSVSLCRRACCPVARAGRRRPASALGEGTGRRGRARGVWSSGVFRARRGDKYRWGLFPPPVCRWWPVLTRTVSSTHCWFEGSLPGFLTIITACWRMVMRLNFPSTQESCQVRTWRQAQVGRGSCAEIHLGNHPLQGRPHLTLHVKRTCRVPSPLTIASSCRGPQMAGWVTQETSHQHIISRNPSRASGMESESGLLAHLQ